MGDDADHWFDEIAEAIEQLGPVRCDHCGGLIDENDEVAEIVKVDDGRLGAVYSNMLVHESCYDRETMVLA